jgi:hypothetical protein
LESKEKYFGRERVSNFPSKAFVVAIDDIMLYGIQYVLRSYCCT